MQCRRGALAVGEAAAAIAVGHGAALGSVEEAFTLAKVDDHTVLVDDDAADDAVATEATRGFHAHRQAAVGLAQSSLEAGEGWFGDDHADVRLGVATVVCA